MREYEITEHLVECESVLVCRGRRLAGGESVLLKILKPEAVIRDERARFKHEFDLVSRLDLPGVATALALKDNDESLAIVFRDIGGQSLDCILKQAPLQLTDSLDLAIALADTVEQIHKRQIIHKDINPANIIYNPATKQVNLIGFGLADELPELNIAPLSLSGAGGALAYISPEQTGRMNRPVDYRADFYSLGITFYRMLTGQLPFEAEDALGMVHCHIAQSPIPPRDINPDIPEIVSAIVMKLLSKMADDRYQSVWGLKADLEKCLGELRGEGTIRPFELGLKDFSDQLRIPRKLYGRANEALRLLGAFDRVAAGGRELVLVAGYSGIGKTSLVHEINWSVAEKKGCFIEGKFDQLQRNVPYFAWLQALGGLVKYILMESEDRLAAWRDSILSAVGSLGRVLTDVIPNLELVIGAQPDVPVLGPTEAQNRFNYVFLEFIKAIATGEHPIVVFLDDLQWIDAASLNLLRILVGSADVSNILVIGAYRDNEVDALHPLAGTIEAMQKDDAKIDLMTLENISEETVNGLIADTLHHEPSRTAPLTGLLYSKTGGNPFFLLQTLRILAEKRAIFVDAKQRHWQWDHSILEATKITDNVVELMLGRIRQLPDETQQLLSLAACVGFRFDLRTLGVVSEYPEDSAAGTLRPALHKGLIAHLEDGYQFAHDRIQQAAYSLIPDERKKSIHLGVGKLLKGLLSDLDHDHDDHIFMVVDHLNMGSELLTAHDDRLELARLNLRAGKKAKASTAFSAAAEYFESGVKMLDEASWKTDYATALELYTRAAEGASLVGHYERTDRLFAVVTDNARNAVDMIGVYESRFNSFAAQGKLQDSMDTSLEILVKLGVHFPQSPELSDIRQCMEETMSHHKGRNIADFVDLPAMTDPRETAIMHVLYSALGSAYSGRPDLFALFSFEAVKRSIKYGSTPESTYVYSCYSFLLCGMPGGNVDDGYKFGELAINSAKISPARELAPRVVGTTVAMTWPYKRHIRDTLPVIKPYFQGAKEVGDFEHAGYMTCFYCANAYLAGCELVGLEREMSAYDQANKQIRAEIARRWQTSFWQAVQNLLGKSENPCVLKGAAYDADAMLPVLEETRNLAGKTALYVNTLILCYLFGEYEHALDASTAAEKHQAGMVGMTIFPVWYFYDSLTRLMLCTQASESERRACLERVDANQAYLEFRAKHAPMNYLNKWHLVEAEKARVQGDIAKAMEYYDSAISAARESGFIHEEALANELAAMFWLGINKEDFARIYMRRAHGCFATWGAARKVLDLEQRYSRLLATKRGEENAETSLDLLDFSTIMKTTSAISGEIELDKLLLKLMGIVVESAGAQNGFLIIEQGGEWQIAAKGGIGVAGVDIRLPAGMEEGGLVARSVVHFVARTKESVVLEDAANQGDFTGDPHIRREKTKSLVCAPLLSLGRLVGILYLENNLTTHAFTPERIHLLEMLLSQAAISLENARIYESLRASEQKFHAIFEQTFQFIGLLSTDGIVLEANQAALQMAGVEEGAVLGKPFRDTPWWAHSSEMRRRVDEAVREAAGGRLVRFEATHAAPDGSLRYVDFSLKPITDSSGSVVRLIPEGRDITERKQAEEELRKRIELETRLAKLAEASPGAVMTFQLLPDGTARIPYASSRTEQLLGFQLEGNADDVAKIQAGIHEDDIEAHLASIAESARTLQHWQNEFRLRHPTRGWIWIEGRSIPEPQDDGSIIWYGFLHDVTARKQRQAREEIRLRIFEGLAQGSELADILQLVVEYVELVNPDFIGTVMLADAERQYLRPVCSRGLPEEYLAAVEKVRIGDGVGSCGAAAWRGETVIAADLRTHPFWIKYKGLALQSGLLSCWSEPIFDASGAVLGTIGIYRRRPGGPSGRELDLVRRAGHLAAIAIERNRSFELLRKREQEFRTLAENTPDVIVRYDRDCRRLYVNPAFEKVNRLTPQAVLGKAPLEVATLLAPIAPIFTQKLREAMEAGTPAEFDLAWNLEDGRRVCYFMRVIPEFTSSGEVAGALVIFSDITERKRMEEQLRASEQKFRTLVANSPNIILRYDRDCRHIYVNPAFERETGIPCDKALGISPDIQWRGNLPPEGYAAKLRRVMDTGQPAEILLEWPRPEDGQLTSHAFHVVAERDLDGEVIGALAIGHNITALKELELRLAKLADSLPGCLYTYRRKPDGSACMPYASPRIQDIFGVAADVLADDAKELLSRISPEDLDSVQASIENSAHNLIPWHDEFRVRHPEKGQRWVEGHAIPKAQPDGGVLLYGFLHDITEHKNLEQELFQAKKMEIIGQLAGGVAHEVRNPLNALLSISEALFCEQEIAENPDYQPYIHHIRTQVGRLSKLMNDLLDLGKPIKAEHIQPVSLHEVLTDTVNLWTATDPMRHNRLNFICDRQSRELLVTVDPTRLQQALLNLLDNALQHSSDNDPVCLQVGAPVERLVTIGIRDAGKGIHPAKLEKVFEPFYTTRKGGTGLGLPLVRHIVESMGGEVKLFNNEPPPGCTAELKFKIERRRDK